MKPGRRVVATQLIVYELKGGRRGEHYGIHEGEEGTVVKHPTLTGAHWVQFKAARVLCDPGCIKGVKEPAPRAEHL